MKIRLVHEIENAASFIKTGFYWKRDCIKMHKHAETFHANKGCKLEIVFFVQNRNLGCNFQTLLARKRGLLHPFFLYGNESLRHYLWYYLKRMATFLILEVRFFQGARFFLRSWVPVRVRFFDDAQNDEQFLKLKKESSHIKMIAHFRQQVYLWYNFQ